PLRRPPGPSGRRALGRRGPAHDARPRPGPRPRLPPTRRADIRAGCTLARRRRAPRALAGRRRAHCRARHPRSPPGLRSGRPGDRGRAVPIAAVTTRISFADVALALLLVAVAIVVSRVRHVGLEGDIGVATLRSFVQLLAIGLVLDYVFRGHSGLTPLVLAVMVVTATLTSATRARLVPGAATVAAASITVATAATLGVLVVLGIVPAAPRATIPLGSM